MKKFLFALLTIVNLLVMYNCSTIMNSTTEEILLKTEPPNAKITVDGKQFGTSPQVVNIDRGTNHVIKFELDGFEVYETQITRKISNWFWANAFNGFIPGMTIDMFTGSFYNLLPRDINVILKPAKVDLKTKKK